MTRKRKKQAGKCLYDGCNEQPETRGLCAKHYIAATRAVRHGKTDWDKLEKAGKVLPRTRANSQDWFATPAKA